MADFGEKIKEGEIIPVTEPAPARNPIPERAPAEPVEVPAEEPLVPA